MSSSRRGDEPLLGRLGPSELGRRGHLRQRHARRMGRKDLQHAQPLLQRSDEVAPLGGID